MTLLQRVGFSALAFVMGPVAAFGGDLDARLASATGVQGVDRDTSGMGPREGVAANPEDRRIARDIRSVLDQDPLTRSTDIRVESRDGTVAFHGSVGEKKAINAASKAAWSTLGVRAVQNNLTLKP
jgi:osmotically-inducible protein OsmY